MSFNRPEKSRPWHGNAHSNISGGNIRDKNNYEEKNEDQDSQALEDLN